MIGANYSVAIVSILNHAWLVFAPVTPEKHSEIARWVQARVRELREQHDGPTCPSLPAPGFPAVHE